MASLNIDLNFFEHPKVKRLRGMVGPEAEVYLLRLWAYVGLYFPDDGLLKEHGALEVEGLVNWRGKPQALLQALIKTGFLKKTSAGYMIHDWKEHEGHLSAYREKARKAALARWGAKVDINIDTLGEGMPQALPQALPLQCSTVQGKTEGEGEAPPAPVSAITGTPPEGEVLALADYYCTARGLVFVNAAARAVTLRSHAVFYPASDLLTKAGGDLALAKRAINDYAVHYKAKGFDAWDLRSVRDDFDKWNTERSKYELKK